MGRNHQEKYHDRLKEHLQDVRVDDEEEGDLKKLNCKLCVAMKMSSAIKKASMESGRILLMKREKARFRVQS